MERTPALQAWYFHGCPPVVLAAYLVLTLMKPPSTIEVTVSVRVVSAGVYVMPSTCRERERGVWLVRFDPALKGYSCGSRGYREVQRWP